MDQLLQFLKDAEIWIYSILGLVGLIYLGRLFSGVREWKQSVFGLEKENARIKISSSLAILVLFLILFAAEFFMVTFSNSTFLQTSVLPTPTLDILATPSATLPLEAFVTSTPEVIQPTLSSINPGQCIPNQIEWISPVDGETIKGSYELFGTVNVGNFGFYKYEYSTVGSENWITIAGNDQQIIKESIGSWNTSTLTPGDYILRLIVYDNANNEYPSCTVQVRIASPD